MQILNISVQNRPAKTVTSKLYPVYSEVQVGSGFALDSVSVSEAIPISEVASTYFSMQDINIVREVMYLKYDGIYSDMKSGCSLDEMIIVKDVRYLSTTIGTDSIKSGLNDIQIVVREALINYTVELHKVSTRFGDISMEIINEP